MVTYRYSIIQPPCPFQLTDRNAPPKEGTLLVNLFRGHLEHTHNAELHVLVQSLDQLDEVFIGSALDSPVQEQDSGFRQSTPVSVHHSRMVKTTGGFALVEHCKGRGSVHSPHVTS